MAEEDTIARRREKRSTAGNRMEAALAEIASEQLPPDADGEEDRDFIGADDEEEVFDSDFASTDEEEAPEEVGERAVQEEEKREHRAARQRAARAIEAAASRQKTTFQVPSKKANGDETPKPSARVRRRVSLGVAVDAVTGEVVKAAPKRKSRRESTVLSSQQTHSRMKDAENKRAAAPRKVREATRILTQAELIASALDTEEGNIREHRDYLKQEEEKRRQARVVRKSLTGPLLRWVSRVEHERPAPQQTLNGHTLSGSVTSTGLHSASTSTPTAQNTTLPYTSQPSTSATSSNPPTGPTTSTSFVVPPPPPYSTSFPFPSLFSSSQSVLATVVNDPSLVSRAFPTPSTPSKPNPTPPPPTEPEPEPEPVSVTKCYAVIELGQEESTPKPKWEDTMTALFGDHVKWDEVKVYSSKNRPLSRPIQKCPLTGKPAPYRDPRTMVPFADVEGYKTLTSILEHKLVWNAELGCYTMNEDDLKGKES